MSVQNNGHTFAFMLEWYHYLLLIAVGFAVGFINTVAGEVPYCPFPRLFSWDCRQPWPMAPIG